MIMDFCCGQVPSDTLPSAMDYDGHATATHLVVMKELFFCVKISSFPGPSAGEGVERNWPLSAVAVTVNEDLLNTVLSFSGVH